MPEISVVMLNYNSYDDLINCYNNLKLQTGVKINYIIIDNNSSSQCINKLKNWKQSLVNSITIDNLDNINKIESINTFFYFNKKNSGYSAGNNIGVKISEKLGINSILISNPDMRYDDKNYCLELYNTLNSDVRTKVSASRIIGLNDKDQSPLREISFIEEVFWIRDFIPYYKKNYSYIDNFNKNEISTVNKVMGCCFMIKLDFLKKINYFDENTFLYSEEAILSSQIKSLDGVIKFNPNIRALHAHDMTKKDNSSKRMLLMLKSRKYYLKNYSGYNFLQLIFLSISYSFLKILHYVKKGLDK